MEIDSKELRAAIDLLDIVPVRSGIQSSLLVGMSASKDVLRMRLKTADIYASAQIGKICLDETKFLPINRIALVAFVRAGTDERYILKPQKEDILLSQGKRKATFQLSDVEESFDLGLTDGEILEIGLAEDFKDAIASARLVASENVVMPEANCIWVEPGKRTKMFSTNDAALCFASCAAGWESSAAFPLPLADAIAKLNPPSLVRRDDVFGIKTESGFLWAKAPSQCQPTGGRGGFPVDGIKNLVTEARKTKGGFEIDTSEFSSKLDAFGGYLSGLNKARTTIKLTGDKGKKIINVESKTPDAEFVDVMAADLGESVSMSFVLPDLQKVIGFLKSRSEKIKMVPRGKICHIIAGNFEFIFFAQVPSDETSTPGQ